MQIYNTLCSRFSKCKKYQFQYSRLLNIGHFLTDVSLNMCKLYFYAVIKITVLLSELMKWLVRKLTDEVDGDGGEFCLGQGINESLLFDTALDMGVQHNT